MTCHGDDPRDLKGELDLTVRERMLAGGESGEPSVVPGDPESSPLYQAVCWNGLEMPPKENDRLTPDEIELIHSWISAGAPWSADDFQPAPLAKPETGEWNAAAAGVMVATSGGLAPEWTNRRYEPDAIWAYRPLSTPSIPGDPQAHPVDNFLQDRLNREGFQAAEPADARTLIRRLTFDLTGLPPHPADVDAFSADCSEAAINGLVERLLGSPQYGEQMARHWLDVVRYADSAGFANDYERPNAWRYRDYVVRSFNADKPYDRFVLEQLAGDELDPHDPDCLIATGFLRMGPWEHTGMSVAALTRQQFLDDVTQSVGVTFLAHGLRCARCHDHKFDPVPTRDYYRIQAAFAPVQFVDRDLEFLDCEKVSPSGAGQSHVQAA